MQREVLIQCSSALSTLLGLLLAGCSTSATSTRTPERILANVDTGEWALLFNDTGTLPEFVPITTDYGGRRYDGLLIPPKAHGRRSFVPERELGTPNFGVIRVPVLVEQDAGEWRIRPADRVVPLDFIRGCESSPAPMLVPFDPPGPRSPKPLPPIPGERHQFFVEGPPKEH